MQQWITRWVSSVIRLQKKWMQFEVPVRIDKNLQHNPFHPSSFLPCLPTCHAGSKSSNIQMYTHRASLRSLKKANFLKSMYCAYLREITRDAESSSSFWGAGSLSKISHPIWILFHTAEKWTGLQLKVTNFWTISVQILLVSLLLGQTIFRMWFYILSLKLELLWFLSSQR